MKRLGQKEMELQGKIAYVIGKVKTAARGKSGPWLKVAVDLYEHAYINGMDVDAISAGLAACDPVPVHDPPEPVNRLVTYFISDDLCSAVKIGRTYNISERLDCLQTGSARTLRVLAVVDGDHEDKFHKRFSHLRLRGEWFSPALELLTFISQLDGDRRHRRHSTRRAV